MRCLGIAVFGLILLEGTIGWEIGEEGGNVAARPPRVYIDRHICPGEGGFYQGRQAQVLKPTVMYAASRARSRRLFRILPGEKVRAVDSEVHAIAGRFVVKRPHGRYQPGDVLWVYTYLGEGVFKIWYGGKMYEENLGFSPWGGSSGSRCEQGKECWGELEGELRMTWWLKITDKRGRQGWIRVDYGSNLQWEQE